MHARMETRLRRQGYVAGVCVIKESLNPHRTFLKEIFYAFATQSLYQFRDGSRITFGIQNPLPSLFQFLGARACMCGVHARTAFTFFSRLHPIKDPQEYPLTKSTMASHPDTKIDCSKVYVKKSLFSNAETGEFDGAFAACPIKKGTLKNIAFCLEP
jgi:hypothetical protein